MPIIYDLFYPRPLARTTDPATSHAAARSMVEPAKAQRERILAYLRANPRGGTIHTIAGAIGLDHVQVARRLPDLLRMGLATPSFEVRQHRGRACRVWMAVVL